MQQCSKFLNSILIFNSSSNYDAKEKKNSQGKTQLQENFRETQEEEEKTENIFLCW